MEPEDQHVIDRAPKRNGSESLQSKSSEELLFFERLGRSWNGNVFEFILLQFLLDGADIAATGWNAGSMDSGNGSETN